MTFAVEKFPPHPSKSEQSVLQPAFDVWDQFRKERDAYVKQRGYDDLKESITWEPETSSTGTRSGSMSGGYFLTESYSVNSVSKADTSIFQEILGYQEQLRVTYANKAEEILKEPAEIRERNVRFADALSRISFADVYNFAVGAIAGTDRQRYNDFIADSRAYKREIVEYLKDKKAFSSRAWFSTDKGAAELTDLPVFKHRRLSLSESFSQASMDVLILLAWNIVLFMTAYVSFLRYDMS
ncbi:hypothetical protein F4Y59_06415 [Candidatus Poribacteria bacterium]|nr:hypothetical protein [Candidatus Poribacteria bacterium]